MSSSTIERFTWSHEPTSPRTTATGAGEVRRKTTELIRLASSHLSIGSRERRSTGGSTGEIGKNGSSQRGSTDLSTKPYRKNTNPKDINEEDDNFDINREDDIEIVWDRGHRHTSDLIGPQQRLLVRRRDNEQKGSGNVEEALQNARITATQGRFIPQGDLEKILTKENVIDELQKSYPTTSSQSLEQIAQKISSHRRVFAILVLIGKTSLIRDFIEAGISDDQLPLREPKQPAQIEDDGLEQQKKSSRLVGIQSSLWDQEAQRKFLAQQWEVMAPVFFESGSPTKTRFYQLEPEEILPFIEDKGETTMSEIEGAFGIVSRIKIHPSHHGFINEFSTRNEFVIKRIKSSNKDTWKQELDALGKLSFIARKQHHLLRALATFRRGEETVFIFPAAEGDFRSYWQHNAPPTRIDEVFINWVVLQTLGLAAALDALHNVPTQGNNEDKKKFYGRHGDIKPENILCFHNIDKDAPWGTLKIADFGLTRFRRFEDAVYHERRGTRTYRAPEVDIHQGLSTQLYDIWSLGCVFLEFLIWALTGAPGTGDKFTAARTMDGSQETTDDNYFLIQTDEKTGIQSAEVKSSVIEWMHMLRCLPNIPPEFLQLLEIIENGMLVADPRKRMNSRQCLRALEDVSKNVTITASYDALQQKHRLLGKIEDRETRVSTADSVISIGARHLNNLRLQKLNKASYTVSLFDRIRLQLECLLDHEIYWWPLHPVNRLLSTSEARLVWEYGGREMSIFLDRRQFQHYRYQLPVSSSGPGILPSSNAATSSKLSTPNILQSYWSSLREVATELCQIWRKNRGLNSNRVATKHPVATASTGTWKESYFCVDKHMTAVKRTSLYTIKSVDSLSDDYELFIRLRESLSIAEGRWSRLMSWRTCTRIRLSKFIFLFDNSDLVKAFEQKIGPGDICEGYEYSRQPNLEFHEHMQLMAETILQGVHEPELGRHGRAVVDGIPKLSAPPGLNKRQHVSGWGFYATQGLCLGKMLWWVSMALLIGVVFVPIWLVKVDSEDLQTAFVPAFFVVSVLTVALGMVAVLGNG